MDLRILNQKLKEIGYDTRLLGGRLTAGIVSTIDEGGTTLRVFEKVCIVTIQGGKYMVEFEIYNLPRGEYFGSTQKVIEKIAEKIPLG